MGLTVSRGNMEWLTDLEEIENREIFYFHFSVKIIMCTFTELEREEFFFLFFPLLLIAYLYFIWSVSSKEQNVWKRFDL